MDRVDTLVVGAGVVGLAVARALAQRGREVVVVEAADGIGQGVSSRSSEVVHAGLYYAPGSLKARLCVRGKALLYELAARQGVPHRRCGKLVVATDTEQHLGLQRLAERAAANGVPLPWLSGDEARRREPALHATAALWSESSGIVDSHALMLALQGDLERAGGQVVLRTVALGARVVPGRAAHVRLRSGAEELEIEAGTLVNATGLGACALTAAIEGLPATNVPLPRYAKGSYFTLAGRAPFGCLVYPAPVDAWLGVHLTLDLGGQARFGPDLEWLPEGTEPAALDYRVDPARAAAFVDAVRRYWPGLPDGALQPAYSGVRPKIHGPDEPAPDFRIEGPAQHGVAGLVNLLGIESPGLTASLAIGEHVAALLAD
jgi:L-2-hydroxyglutarate oxidase LhgO